MRFRRRITVAIGGLLASGVMVLPAFISAPASAVASNEICGNYGNGYCLNNWNGGGSGNAIKMYYGNNSNEAFVVRPVDECDGGDISTKTCPFQNRTLDNEYQGQQVVEYQYGSTGLCVASSSGGKAILGTCDNTNTGSGGADGVLFLEWDANNCQAADGTPQGLHYAINRYWSDADGTAETLQSGGNPGVQAYLNYSGFNTCWAVN
jgi:hypothetical protein